MAIDRIGKGAVPPTGLPSSPETSGAGAAGKAGAPFAVERPEPAGSTERAGSGERAGAADPARAASGASPLERLRAGEVDVDGYVDLEVDKATSSLKGLPVAELEEIKSVLRDQMKSDPGLVDLVRTATGKLPTPPED